MNDLVANNVVTMTSLELVDFINANRAPGEADLRHDNFMAKVPRVLGEEAALNFKASYLGKDGTKRPLYRFPKREACLMAMSYSYELQAKVFDRMTALEQQQQQALPDPANMSRMQLIQLALDAEQERLKLEGELAIAAPKVAGFERIAVSDGGRCITDAAKELQIAPKALFDWMNRSSWIYKRYGNPNWIAYQDKIQQGLLTHKVNVLTREDGTEKTVTQVVVTPRGLTRLAKEYI